VTAELFVEPPTLINLHSRWRIEGDDNRNARVEVQYRRTGDREWQRGMDLFRLNGERVLSNVRFDVINPNMFTGSILDLEPDTAYDVRLEMSDPDGVFGDRVKTVHVRTRPEPMPYAGGRVFHVYPHDWGRPTRAWLVSRSDGGVQQLDDPAPT
jgi:hypothetical protein